MSVKYQITLPDELAFRMREASHRLEVPLAQFIRETMEEKLAQLRTAPPRDRLAAIRGIVEGDAGCSTEIDDVIAAGLIVR